MLAQLEACGPRAMRRRGRCRLVERDAGCAALDAWALSVMGRACSYACGENSSFSEAIADAIERFDHFEIRVHQFELFA